MLNRAILIAFLAAVFSAAPAFALSLDIEKTSYRVSVGSTEAIPIFITGDGKETVILSLNGEKTWTILSAYSIETVEARKDNVTLYITPPREVVSGINYKLTLTAKGLNTQREDSKDIYIFVSRDDVVDIDKTSISGDFFPTGNINAKIYVKNYRSTTVQNVNVNVTFASMNGMIKVEGTRIPVIAPAESKIAEINFRVPENMPAGVYWIDVALSSKDSQLSAKQEFEIYEKAVMIEKVSPVLMITGHGEKIEVKNAGNIAGNATIARNISGTGAWFLAGTKYSSSDKGSYLWHLNDIEPGKSAVIEQKIDYLPLVLLLAALVAGAWYYLYKMRVLRVRKYIMQKKVISEGTEFTVGVELKNATGRKIDSVTIKDFVPPVFVVKDSVGPKFIKRKHAYGTDLTWKLKDMNNRDERIVSYKIVPIFGLNSSLALPKASAAYLLGKNLMRSLSEEALLGHVPKKKVERN
ncbi:MAG: hypothetical protein HY364_01655 [Candidatus Aenigmarchaeota archaeon]|nr:hypothetical protein [Candidatus Aenigmarchaeota archaeon]